MPEDTLSTTLDFVDAPDAVAERATDLCDAAATLDVEERDTPGAVAASVLVAASECDLDVNPADLASVASPAEITRHLDTFAGPVRWFADARNATVEMGDELDLDDGIRSEAVRYLADAAEEASNAPARPCAGIAVLAAGRRAGESLTQQAVAEVADCSVPTLRTHRERIAPDVVASERGPSEGTPDRDAVERALESTHASFEAFTDVVLHDAHDLIDERGLDWAERRSPRVAAAALYYAAANDRGVAPSQERVAEAADCSRPSVTRAYTALNETRFD